MSRRHASLLGVLCITFTALLGTQSAFAAPPGNDAFEAPTALGIVLPLDTNGTTAEATTQTGEPDHSGVGVGPSHSVWYTITPPAGTVNVDVCTASGQSEVAVYSGNTVNGLTLVGGGEFDCNAGFVATGTTEYRIAVDSASGGEGFTLAAKLLSPPANDPFAGAVTVGPALPVSQPGTTVDATRQVGEPKGGEASVWYQFTPTTSQVVTLDTCTNDFDNRIYVYTGATLNTLTERAWDDDGCVSNTGARLSMPVAAGTTYSIAVRNFSDPDSSSPTGSGTFTLAITAPTGGVPTAPVITGTTPSSPGSANDVDVGVDVPSGSAGLFSTANCAPGSELGSIRTIVFGSGSLTAHVADGSTTTFYAKRYTPSGESPCSTTFATYTQDSVHPVAPTFLGSTPGSGSNDNHPKLRGTAEAGSTVEIFKGAGCNNAAVATGTAAAFASPGLPVTVADNSTNTFSVQATDAAENVSFCTGGTLTYVEKTTPPVKPKPKPKKKKCGKKKKGKGKSLAVAAKKKKCGKKKK